MEIKYDNFRKWMNAVREIPLHLDPLKVTGADRANLHSTSYHIVTSRTRERINDCRYELCTLIPKEQVYTEVVAEIDLNIVNIATPEQVTRYLTYLKNELRISLHFIEASLNYDWLYENREMLVPEYEIDTLAPGHIPLVTDNPVERYFCECLNAVAAYQELDEYLERQLNPEHMTMFGEELTANTHKLLLLHKTGVFEPLYLAYHETLGSFRFSKLIATLLGVEPSKQDGFRPSVNGLIKEILKPHEKKTVQTERAEETVNAFLIRIGINNNA